MLAQLGEQMDNSLVVIKEKKKKVKTFLTPNQNPYNNVGDEMNYREHMYCINAAYR